VGIDVGAELVGHRQGHRAVGPGRERDQLPIGIWFRDQRGLYGGGREQPCGHDSRPGHLQGLGDAELKLGGSREVVGG
jgi:hypothetical protein